MKLCGHNPQHRLGSEGLRGERVEGCGRERVMEEKGRRHRGNEGQREGGREEGRRRVGGR